MEIIGLCSAPGAELKSVEFSGGPSIDTEIDFFFRFFFRISLVRCTFWERDCPSPCSLCSCQKKLSGGGGEGGGGGWHLEEKTGGRSSGQSAQARHHRNRSGRRVRRHRGRCRRSRHGRRHGRRQRAGSGSRGTALQRQEEGRASAVQCHRAAARRAHNLSGGG